MKENFYLCGSKIEDIEVELMEQEVQESAVAEDGDTDMVRNKLIV